MKLHVALAILLLNGTGLFAIETKFLEPVRPASPVLMAQGGVSTANAQGFDALFVNPAAFADTKTDLTFLSTETTTHLSLSGLNLFLNAHDSWSTFSPSNPGQGPLVTTLNNLVSGAAVGQEASLGAGWVGKNLGLAVMVQGRGTANGANLTDAATTIDTTVTGVVGFAWPFDVGLGTLQVGGAIRPMQKSYTPAPLPFGEILNHYSDLSRFNISSGFGLGLDLGVRWNYAGFASGLAVRDVSGTVLNFKSFKMSDWVKGYGFPSGGDASGSQVFRIPTVVAFGTEWTPDMGPLTSLFQPALGVDFQIPITDQLRQTSFWTWTHVGAEAKFLQFFSVRTGLNQGYLTFGLGAKLFLVDFNLAVYSEELGRNSGTTRRPGISLNWAFRL